MKIVEPYVEIITEEDPLKRIELCGRVCYKSESKITSDSAEEFVQRAVNRGHTSILEHARVNIPKNALLNIPGSTPYGARDRRGIYDTIDTINCRDLMATDALTVRELSGMVNAKDYVTARFVTDRGTLIQLTRHRIMSFSAESTKFIKYNDGITVVKPIPFSWAHENDVRYMIWQESCYKAEKAYQQLILEGCSAQEARSVLPQSTKTELIMTGTYDAWDTVFALRTPKGVQPQTRYMMKLLLDTGAFDNIKDKFVDNLKDMEN